MYTPGPYRRASAWLCGVHEERFQRSSTSQADQKTNVWWAILLYFAVDCAGLSGWEYMRSVANAPPTPAQ